jgi:pimeloyl-ACP methyl ester carboxylesterase
VNLVPDYKILHDAGYNVLTYDLRNHGLSGAANGGIVTNGITESRDVVGSLDYARKRFGAHEMAVGLFSRCTGGNSTFYAMAHWPAAFNSVRCLVSPQPITTAIIIQHRMAMFGIADRFEDFKSIVRLRTSIGLEQRVPQEWAKSVRVPTFLYGVRDDVLTDPSDIQAMFDNIPIAEKRLQWIENTTARWDGYLEFQRRPQHILDWFAQYM